MYRMDNTTIADMLIRLSNKLDTISDSLPQRYVPRSEFEPWRMIVETRVKSLEDNISSFKDNLQAKTDERNRLGMQALRDIDAKIEQRHQLLIDRLEHTEQEIKNTNDNSFNKKVVVFSLVFAGMGSLIGISDFIIAHLHV